MAATSTYAAGGGGGGKAVGSPFRGILLRARPTPPRLAFLSRLPSRWASISLPPGIHRAAPAAAAAEGRLGKEEEEEPAWVELETIGSEEQLDRALAEAQQHDLPIVPIVLFWTASWCRKCIYLKPKLEKLAAEYYPRIRFYCVDVNAVPQKLVNRAGVTLFKYMGGQLGSQVYINLNTNAFFCPMYVICYAELEQKMPAIQMWRDSRKQAEVIGGHKSWLVIDDVRRMIEQEE